MTGRLQQAIISEEQPTQLFPVFFHFQCFNVNERVWQINATSGCYTFNTKNVNCLRIRKSMNMYKDWPGECDWTELNQRIKMETHRTPHEGGTWQFFPRISEHSQTTETMTTTWWNVWLLHFAYVLQNTLLEVNNPTFGKKVYTIPTFINDSKNLSSGSTEYFGEGPKKEQVRGTVHSRTLVWSLMLDNAITKRKWERFIVFIFL